MADGQLMDSNLVTGRKFGRSSSQMLHPMLQGTMFSPWNLLPQRITIKDLLLLEINHNRYPVVWKVHNTTQGINLPFDDAILSHHKSIP